METTIIHSALSCKADGIYAEMELRISNMIRKAILPTISINLSKNKFILDLRYYTATGFMEKQLRGMESNGNTAVFKAKDRFDGILFIRYSDLPTLLKD